MLSKIARKKLENDRAKTPNTMHFDISHNFDKPYFKAPHKELLKIDELSKKPSQSPPKQDETARPLSRQKDSPEDYRQSLQKEIPFALSEKNPPGSRLEQKLLKKWLESQTAEIEATFSDVTQKMARKNIVYGLVFEELKRQLGCSCVETGDLLRELWEFQKKAKEIGDLELEMRKRKELREIRRDYETRIKSLEVMIAEKDTVINQKQEMFEESLLDATSKEKTILKLQENEHSLNKKLSEVRKMLTFIRKKAEWLTKENESLMLKYEKNSPHERTNKPPQPESSENDSSADEKIMIDIKETEGQEEHNINDLNQVIVSSIPEVKDIKKMYDQSTNIDNDFAPRYMKEMNIQTEFTLMEKIFEKNLKSMIVLEEMCLDYQYKQQIKDTNSKKFRASVIAVENLFEKITGRPSFSGSSRKSMQGIEVANLPVQKLEIEKEKDGKEEHSKENSIESDVFSQRNSLNNLETGEENVQGIQINEKENEKNEEKQIDTLFDPAEIKENQEESKESISDTPGIQEDLKDFQTDDRNPVVVSNEDLSNKPTSYHKGSLFYLESQNKHPLSPPKKDYSNTESYIPSITIMNSPSHSQKPRVTAQTSREIIRVRPSGQSFGKDRNTEFDFEKVVELFQSENIKAQDFEDKFKRNLEVLQVENAQRKKLESKNMELLKHIELMQQELDKLKKSRDSTIRLLSNEKRRKGTQLDKGTVRENIMGEIAHLKEEAKIRRNKKLEKKEKRAPEMKIPQLGQHITIEYEHQKQNLGSILLEKIKNKKMAKFHNFMHLKLILKQIHMIYFERIAQTKENTAIKEHDFASYVYTFFLSLFGLKKIADKRFIILILSIKKQLSFFRVNIFARFLGLLEPNYLNYSIDELNKYLEALDFVINTSSMGTSIVNNESDSKFYIPYIRAVHYTGIFADTRMTNEENMELKKEIDGLKEVDARNINKTGIIDFDAFMEKILNKYKILVNRAKTYVINAFAACDLDGNKMCNLQEFLMLNRHIESKIYDEDKLQKIFMNNADLEKNGEKNLSFDRFSVVCVEYNLFTDEVQDKYLGITKKVHLEIKMEELLKVWPAKKMEIEKRFEGLSILSKEEIGNWNEIISVLNERITGKIEAELKPTLIAYKMLEEESKWLVEEQKKYEEEGEFGDGDDEMFDELEGEGEDLENDIL